jgi:hypothetical protein
MELDSEIVRSKYNGPCRVCPAASTRSSRLRSVVACGSPASSRAYRSAALRPPVGGLPSGVPSGAFRWPNSRSYAPRFTTWPGSKPSACAPGPDQRPGGSPPASLA